uniref:Uncharacterized protein n=1 Tax=Arundo donax TaxID=35708 RepID=A0A0A8ZI12_ARUDO
MVAASLETLQETLSANKLG